MLNLKLIKDQPRWRVAMVHLVAKALGVLILVEGFPFGCRIYPRKRGVSEFEGRKLRGDYPY